LSEKSAPQIWQIFCKNENCLGKKNLSNSSQDLFLLNFSLTRTAALQQQQQQQQQQQTQTSPTTTTTTSLSSGKANKQAN
jgi:hypothetical protein